MALPVVELRGIVKQFGDVVANAGIDLALHAGEIHGLLGENGAGKSTLMEILSGRYRPDGGSILIDDEPVNITSTRDSIRLGVGMVHQHLSLIPEFSVVENVIAGHPKNPVVINRDAAAREVKAVSERYGLAIDPSALVRTLSVGEAQRIEIIKVLFRGARILVLDEPTSRLSPPEVAELENILRAFRDGGGAVAFVSHKLEEVLRICDRITVLRSGRNVATIPGSEATAQGLADLMVGRPVLLKVEKPPIEPGEDILRLDGVVALGADERRVLDGISFCVRGREIVGVAGVDGNGQRQMFEAILGLLPITEGSMHLHSRDITSASPAERIDGGIGCIPDDRQRMGLVLEMSVGDNLSMKAIRDRSLTRRGVLSPKSIRSFAQKLISGFGIRPKSPRARMKELSGGNQQKCVVAREMNAEPRILLVSQPTAGLDVGTIEQVYKRIIEARNRGLGVLLVSNELSEILSLSDRVAVMFRGRLTDPKPSSQVTSEELGMQMAGMGYEAP